MIAFKPLPTPLVRALQSGSPDANGQTPERGTSDGPGNPCRHCLQNIPRGAAMLTLSARPFPQLQPYAETGPIYLCAEACAPWTRGARPPVLATSETYLLRGYDANDRIVGGTGSVIAQEQMEPHATDLLHDDRVAYIHVRSSSNNCYLARIDRQGGSDDSTT